MLPERYCPGMERTNNHHPLLTVAEVAERLGINTTKVGKFISDGSLRAIDVSYNPRQGKPRWRVSVEALAEFETARSNSPAPPQKIHRKAIPRPPTEYV